MEKLISRGELAEKLGLSPQTIFNYVREGKIPFFRIGKNYLFDLEEVKNAIRKPVKSEVRNG